MKNLLLLLLFLLFLRLYQLIEFNKVQEIEINQLKKELKEAQWHKQRVSYYLQINLRQQELLNNHPKAKKSIQNDSTLMQLNLHIQ